MGSISFKRGKQSQKVPSINFKVAGLCFDLPDAKLPAGFTITDRVKPIFSVTDAKALGIVDTHADETKASTGGTLTVSSAGAVGDKINVYIQPIGIDKKTLLGSYVVDTATVQAVSEGIASAINSNKANHVIDGQMYPFVATVGAGPGYAITLSAPAKLGASINSSALSCERFASNGTAATLGITAVQFSGGVGSKIAILYYHIAEFFRLCPEGKLYVGIYDSVGSTTSKWEAAALKRMQDYAEGEIKRFGAWTATKIDEYSEIVSLASGFHTIYQTLFAEKRYAEIIVTSDNYSATALVLSSLSDIRANDFDSVTIDLGNSGSGEGWRLLGVVGVTVGTTGAWLGVRSQIPCNHSVGSREFAVLVGNGEYVSCAFSNGQRFKAVYTSSANLVTQLEAFGYLFPKQYQDDSKSVFCTDNNCGVGTGDYTESKNLETFHKAARLIYLNAIPKIEGQLYIDAATGQIDDVSREAIHSAAYSILEKMGADGEISTDADGKVPYDSVVVADFIVDGELITNVEITETQTLKKLTFAIGFKTKF